MDKNKKEANYCKARSIIWLRNKFEKKVSNVEQN